MSYCTDLGYKVGDLFVTTIDDYSGVKYKLVFDDGTTCPKFSYVNPEDQKGACNEVYIDLDEVRKVESVESIETCTEQTYTEAEIRVALEDAGHGPVFTKAFMDILKHTKLEQSDDYKEYIRLKEKLGL